ncbi:glutamate receptor ionotropic, delta-1 [Phlebotomus argentipes]|uniref:glutamate receptor ionotropic, delta-1 n=1 Tax=Phlebotomus argentipes TaxID=94469 RepID=UPI0028932140|nr:glutamate receptor ionotropic, delta-1 [Phlebotomus argentipes]
MEGIEMLFESVCRNSTCDSEPESDYTVGISTNMSDLTSWEMKNHMLDQIKREINGKTLKVVTINDKPLSFVETINGSLTGTGVSFDLLEFLTEKFNFTYELIVPEKNILGSTQDIEGSLIEILGDGRADFAAAFLPILSDAREHIYYSKTTLDEGEWIMIMTRPAESATGSGLWAPFDLNVWILILLSLICVGPIIYALIIIRTKLTRDREQTIYPLPYCIWFVYGALMKQGSTLSPIGDSTRLLFATWWIFITILTSFYTANLTAFLTLSKFTLPINNVGDILRKQKNFVANRGGAVEYAIKNNGEALTQLSRMVEKNLVQFSASLNDTEILLQDVERRNYLYVRDRPAINHLIYSDYVYRKTISLTDEKIQCPFAVAKTPFMKRKRAFAYPKNSTLHLLFDPVLLHLVESGIVKYKLWKDLPDAEICPSNLVSTERQLRNGDLMMTYYIMIAGFCTSTAVFFSELLFRCLNNRGICVPKARADKHKWARVRDDVTVDSVTPPPPYTTLFNRSRNILGGIAEQKDFAMRESNGLQRQNINGREYFVVKGSDGVSRLIPLRVPSAALFQYSYTK